MDREYLKNVALAVIGAIIGYYALMAALQLAEQCAITAHEINRAWFLENMLELQQAWKDRRDA